MKIISKRKDYYDYLGQIYGVDSVVVYIRKPATIDNAKHYIRSQEFTPSERNQIKVPVSVNLVHIWFCDQNYPLLELSYVPTNKLDRVYFYYASNEAFLEDYGDILYLGGYRRAGKAIEEHFKSKLKSKLNTKYGSPQLLVDTKGVHLDIRLRDYNFQKLVSPEQAFQRVSMFLGAFKPDKPQQIPTDMHRFEAKGFDKKTSFRNM